MLSGVQHKLVVTAGCCLPGVGWISVSQAVAAVELLCVRNGKLDSAGVLNPDVWESLAFPPFAYFRVKVAKNDVADGAELAC